MRPLACAGTDDERTNVNLHHPARAERPALTRTRTGIAIGSAHQRRHIPSTEEQRIQAALLAKRRRSLAERASAAFSLIGYLSMTALAVACLVAIAVFTGTPHDHA